MKFIKISTKLFIIVFLLVIYEDLIRKFVAGHIPLIFLIKDSSLIIIYILFIFELAYKKKKLINIPILIPILLLLIYEITSILWMHEKNILVFISGLKIDFFYIPIIFMVPYLLQEKKLFIQLNRITKQGVIYEMQSM